MDLVWKKIKNTKTNTYTDSQETGYEPSSQTFGLWLGTYNISFQRDDNDIQSSTLNQKHGWFKKEERWSLWKVIFSLSETSFSSLITAELANTNFELTLFLGAIVIPRLSCFVGK